MATKNAKTTKKAATQTKAAKKSAETIQPETTDPTVQSGTGVVNNNTQHTPEELKGGEKELQVPTEPGNGQETNDEGVAGLDTAGKETTTGKEGGDANDPVNPKLTNEPTETTTKRQRIANDVFSKHPKQKELYFTTDLIPFFQKTDAIRHGAGTLKNDTIVTIYRKK